MSAAAENGNGYRFQDPRFKLFHELMGRKVRDVLVIATPYDAWILEEDTRLSERITGEYRGLNLSSPPRLWWASTLEQALEVLAVRAFDLLVLFARSGEQDARAMARAAREKEPDLPVMVLSHGTEPTLECEIPGPTGKAVDLSFQWTGNSEILLAMVKSAEDLMNAPRDTELAGIRVVLFVEDSPEYLSAILPILYREIVLQTQSVIEEGLNEEHRLLAMRARPKVLVATSFEEAVEVFERYEPFILGVLSDVRFPRDCELDENAGVDLLERVREHRFDIPLLLMSSESRNAARADGAGAVFIDKNSPFLISEVRRFLQTRLGFGDFVFRDKSGAETHRARNLRELEAALREITAEQFLAHARNNDFSRWLFARTEIELATRVRAIRSGDLKAAAAQKASLAAMIHDRRIARQRGVVVAFDAHGFDPDTEFSRIGGGSLGGKARGLAFMSNLLQQKSTRDLHMDGIGIFIPRTLVLTTEEFETFVRAGGLEDCAREDMEDAEVARRFLETPVRPELARQLGAYLGRVTVPLAVRSSSLLEDARFCAYAGLYKTYMLPNSGDLDCRLDQLLTAVRLVFASTYFTDPKAFSRRMGLRPEDERMAVMIQQMTGAREGRYVYPALSGVAQSYNYYPFGPMRPEDGVASICLGLGRSVMEGESSLRFSPKHPEHLPQRGSVDEILSASQRFFYALDTEERECSLDPDEAATLARLEVADAGEHHAVRALSSTFLPDEQRLVDSHAPGGWPVLTFAPVLKHGLFPLPELLSRLVEVGRDGLGAQVEIEFSVDLPEEPDQPARFALLQIRPMAARVEMRCVEIAPEDRERAFLVSTMALGNTVQDMADIVYVKPGAFNPAKTRDIAREIGRLNHTLATEGVPYLLMGPGRWGSADPWLGIPVRWNDIRGVGCMAECAHPALSADPSQGSHFFHNITSLGLPYLTVRNSDGRVDWDWIARQPVMAETEYTAHARTPAPFTVKVDGREALGVVVRGREDG